MKPTLDYVVAKFNEYNALCFEGRLPLPRFQISQARTFMGKVSYKRTRSFWGRCHYGDFVFRISNRRDLPEVEVEDTILHEMIHLDIMSSQQRDSSAHGRLFREKMRDINSRFGRHITISHRLTVADKANDVERRRHFVCVSHMNNGRWGVTLAAHTRLHELWERMDRVPEIVSHSWYLSTDPFFNRFPRSCTAKVYHITKEELDRHLKDAKPLVRKGHAIQISCNSWSVE
jgi:hypothetical protein